MSMAKIKDWYEECFEKKYSVKFFWKTRKKATEGRGIVKLFAQLRYHKLQLQNGAYIPLSVKFSDKAIFPHGISGIFISAGAEIGKDCIIFQQATIGSNTLPDSKSIGSPTLGDHVFVGAGAKIIGNVKIGNRVRIGANCIVTKDVPDDCTVVMGAPRVIVHETELNNAFVPYQNFLTKDEETNE